MNGRQSGAPGTLRRSGCNSLHRALRRHQMLATEQVAAVEQVVQLIQRLAPIKAPSGHTL